MCVLWHRKRSEWVWELQSSNPREFVPQFTDGITQALCGRTAAVVSTPQLPQDIEALHCIRRLMRDREKRSSDSVEGPFLNRARSLRFGKIVQTRSCAGSRAFNLSQSGGLELQKLVLLPTVLSVFVRFALAKKQATESLVEKVEYHNRCAYKKNNT